MIPTIMLADDHIMISKGMRKQLESDFGYRDIDSVATCTELLRELKKKEYTHLILDIGLSDGSTIEIIPVIQSLYPGVRIMIFTAKPYDVFEKAFRHLNIRHYLSKESGEEETMKRLQLFFYGRDSIQEKRMEVSGNPFSLLANRELQVLHYLLKGMGTNEIASALNVKHNTVSTIKRKIFEKTEVTNLKELMDLSEFYKVGQ